MMGCKQGPEPTVPALPTSPPVGDAIELEGVVRAVTFDDQHLYALLDDGTYRFGDEAGWERIADGTAFANELLVFGGRLWRRTIPNWGVHSLDLDDSEAGWTSEATNLDCVTSVDGVGFATRTTTPGVSRFDGTWASWSDPGEACFRADGDSMGTIGDRVLFVRQFPEPTLYWNDVADGGWATVETMPEAFRSSLTLLYGLTRPAASDAQRLWMTPLLGDGPILVSADGVGWEELPVLSEMGLATVVEHGGEVWLGTGQVDGSVFRLAGDHWEQIVVEPDPDSGALRRLLVWNEQLLLVDGLGIRPLDAG